MKKLIGLSLLFTACASLPSAGPHAFVTPPASGSPVQVCWVDTGGVTVPGGYGAGGSTVAATWEVTSAALVIRHPKGDLVLDTGISPQAQEEQRELGAWKRFTFSQTAGRNVPRRNLKDALTALGVTQPKALLLSHVHADHAGGAALLPGVPVWLAAEEKQLVEAELEHPRGVALPAQARALKGRMVPIPFAAEPYANYEARFDVFGDGSVVVVPTFGHTPGSVATFVNVSPSQRFVHVGDLINLSESIERNVGKSWLMRQLTDEDLARTEAEVAKLVQLHAQDPELLILPAHDRRAFVKLFGADDGGVPPCIGTPPPSQSHTSSLTTGD
ncbi:MBL fold metallo-hydrolase [Archangium lansingense]|uniref:MBL fold metallo-hydrolase n=1 Tax=Archangium lansingense TaxID=2995310 RepID=A0ABT4AM07_9BACT|nr:MBL fold metallo-hydrolase [Archangium lansinium]MCY1082740.1 MBL fold metallo-hydrolase [Archangium lansinium]